MKAPGIVVADVLAGAANFRSALQSSGVRVADAMDGWITSTHRQMSDGRCWCCRKTWPCSEFIAATERVAARRAAPSTTPGS